MSYRIDTPVTFGVGNVNLPGLTASSVMQTDASKNITTGAVSLTSQVTGILPATNGGTGSGSNPTTGQIPVATSSNTYVPTTVASGTGISTTTGSGSLQINNTGVTSLAGTANQATVSASTGSVTISTPATFVAPGTIQDTTGMMYSTATVAAAGSTQGTATALTKSYNVVTPVASSTGVALPTPPAAGLRVVVINKGANTLNVYPATGGAIDAASTNTAVTLPVNGAATYQAASTTQWYTVNPNTVGGSGISITYGNGQTSVALSTPVSPSNGGTGTTSTPTTGQVLVATSGGVYTPATVASGTGISTTTGSGTLQINNTGVTSLAGTANQAAVSASTGSVTISTPATFVAPGTIQDTTGMLYSTAAAVSAAGSTQGTATALTKSYNVVTTVASSTGVALPTPSAAGFRVVVVNKGANTLNVYPAVGGAIDAAGTNTAVTLLVNGTATYQAASTTQWYTVNPPVIGGAGITITYGNGQTSIALSTPVSIANGGTNSSAALTGNKIMVSNAGGTAIVEGTSSLTPTFTSETLTATTSQLTLGAASHTTVISATAPASASVTYTLADAGGNANIPLATNSSTTGFVLTATGAGSVATWQDPVATGVSKVLFTGTGNNGGISIFTPTANMSQMYLTLLGGGGAGGNQGTANSGGGGAGHAINKLPIPLPAGTNPCVVIIGAGATGALTTGTPTTAGNSIFLYNTTIYNTGTASATASTTITGSGTTWTSSMVGGVFISGATSVRITGWTSATSITVATPVTVSGSYNIYFPGPNTITYTAYGGGNGSSVSSQAGGGGGAGGADSAGNGGPAATVWPQLGPAGAPGTMNSVGAPGAVGGFSVSGGAGGGSGVNGAASPGGIGGIGAGAAVGGGGGAAGFRGNGGAGAPVPITTTNLTLIGTGAGSTGANPSTFTVLPGSSTNIFVSQFDYIYVGVTSPYSAVFFNSVNGASSSISPAFQYSIAGTSWTTISSANDVDDETAGFQNTLGSFVFFRGPPYTTLTSNPWVQQLVNGTLAYWFRIQRTAATVTTVPKASSSTLNGSTGYNGGYSAAPNTGAGGGGGLAFNDEIISAVSGGDGGSGFCEIWYE